MLRVLAVAPNAGEEKGTPTPGRVPQLPRLFNFSTSESERVSDHPFPHLLAQRPGEVGQ